MKSTIAVFALVVSSVYGGAAGPSLPAGRQSVFDLQGRPILSSSGERFLYHRMGEKHDTALPKVLQEEGSFSVPSQHFVHLSDSLQPLLREGWQFGIFGSGIGETGIITQDIDADGDNEIVCGGLAGGLSGQNNFWYVLEYVANNETYQARWFSDPYVEGITNMGAFDINNDGVTEILLGLDGGELQIYDGPALVQVASVNTPAQQINNITIADADNDQTNEIVLCDYNTLYIYDPISLHLERQLPYGSSDFEVGNVDADSHLEIVVAGGQVLQLINDALTVEWTYAAGEFGSSVELSDFDSDGMEEIIAASPWYYITAFDADLQSPKWQISTTHDIGALHLQDVDHDEIEEVLYGDGQWGQIHCYDAVSVTERWQIANPEHGVTNLGVHDTDGDSELELLWGAGASSSGPDFLFVHGIPTLAREWQSDHVDGPFNSIDVGDVDMDGNEEIVFVSSRSNSGYGDGLVFVFDAVTYELEWKSDEDFLGYTWTGVHAVRIGDVDDDGQTEIIVGTDYLYDGVIHIINGSTRDIEASYFYDSGTPIYALAVGDVDSDGETEIVAGGGHAHSGSPGVYVYVIDGRSGVVEWHSIDLGIYSSYVESLELGQVDDDSNQEIVATKGYVFVFDGITHEQWQSTLTDCRSLDLFDIDGDGVHEVIAGTGNGHVVAFDGTTHAQELDVAVSSSAVDAIEISDLEGNGSAELLFASEGQLTAYDLTGQAIVWESAAMGTTTGDFDAMLVKDVDQNEAFEIMIGGDQSVTIFHSLRNFPAFADDVQDWPISFSLEQNYPNPFNPRTTIGYSLPERAQVRLEVFDMIGQSVALLFDGEQAAGYHSAVFDGERLASGMYLYRLKANEFTQAKSFLLLK